MDEPTSRYTSPDPAGSVPPQQPSPAGSVPPQQPSPAATLPPVQPAATPPPPPQPTWRPQADRGGSASLIFGVIILIIGLWFFSTRTLGLDLTDIEWSNL